jgi:hypothetical protein
MSVGSQPSSSATIDSSSAWWLPVASLGATAGPLPLVAAAADLGACKAQAVDSTGLLDRDIAALETLSLTNSWLVAQKDR